MRTKLQWTCFARHMNRGTPDDRRHLRSQVQRGVEKRGRASFLGQWRSVGSGMRIDLLESGTRRRAAVPQ